MAAPYDKKPIRKVSTMDDVIKPEYDDTIEQSGGFDITYQQVIGRVDYGRGDHSAHEEAFMAVARHDTAGDYQWTQSDGITTKLTVEYVFPEKA
jgi:hypothetical protein